ncbi:hypothetical protein AB7M29_000864 [Pseudomonas sp. F-14 TE3623]
MARGLAPVGLRSSPIICIPIPSVTPHGLIGDCYAAERGQAPSPQVPPLNKNADAVLAVGVETLKGLETAINQNAGSTAPLYFLAMNAFTSGLVRALASFWMATLSLLSGRATRKFT